MKKGEQTGKSSPQHALGLEKPMTWCCPFCTLLVLPLSAQFLYFLHNKHSMPFHQPLRLQINHLRSKLCLDLCLMKAPCHTHILTHPDCVDMDAIQSVPSNIPLNLLVADWLVFIFGDGVWISNPSWLQTCSNPASGS